MSSTDQENTSFSSSDLPLADILHHDSLYWSCIATVEQKDGWVFFHNRCLIPRIDPNHAGEFRAGPGQSRRIVGEIIGVFRALGTTPAAYVDALATPSDLIPALLEAGFEEWTGAWSDLMLYGGAEVPLSTAHAVERVTTREAKVAWASIQEAGEPEAQRLLQELYVTQISDPRMMAYLVRVQGEPASRCQLFSSQGLGRVEAVRTQARFRGQGLASAAIKQAVRDSMQENRLTYIYAEPGGAAQQLYQRLGFHTVIQNAMRGFVYSGQ